MELNADDIIQRVAVKAAERIADGLVREAILEARLAAQEDQSE